MATRSPELFRITADEIKANTIYADWVVSWNFVLTGLVIIVMFYFIVKLSSRISALEEKEKEK